jgi:hypothetical protein
MKTMPEQSRAREREPLIGAALLVLAASQLGLGAWMAAAPRSFFDAIGGFGAFNDHYVRDVSTWYLALGAALLVAWRRPPWRVPVLALALAQYALHAVNHLVDAGDADPSWVGPADAAALAAGALAFGLLLAIVPGRRGGTEP